MRIEVGFVNKALLSFTLLFVLCMNNLRSQDYQTGVGLRGGFPAAITIKHFVGQNAIEGLIGSRWGGFSLTGLYEVHKDNAFDVNRLNWYYGIGGHIAFYNGSAGPYAVSYTAIGVDGILGIEYNIQEAPINISLDYKPALNFGTYFFARGDEGAISVRYIF